MMPAFGATLRVPADYSSIQAAIVAATTNDLVLVSPGIYNEAIDFSGKAITVASQFWETGNPTNVLTTIISPSAGLSGVTASSGEGTNSRLIGFTITGCSGLNAAAVYCYQGSLSILQCLITSNDCRGVIMYKSHSVLRGNEIHGNPSFYANGPDNAIHCVQSDPLIESNTIYAADPNGNIDAIYHSTTEPATNLQTVIRGNVIFGRLEGEFHAGGPTHLICQNLIVIENGFGEAVMITGSDSGLKIFNNTIIGGRFNVQHDATPCFFNNIVANGGLDFPLNAPMPDVRYNDFWQCGYISDEFKTNGNTFVDPRFVNSTNHNFQLLPDSPSIDAGDPATSPDPDGTRADQGAFYFNGTYQGWLQRHFSTAVLADTNAQQTVWGTEADPDFDGAPNLYEYFCSSDPLVPDSELQRLSLKADGTNSQVIYRQNEHIVGVTIELQSADALPFWNPTSLTGQSVVDFGDSLLIQATIPNAGKNVRFFRLKIGLAP